MAKTVQYGSKQPLSDIAEARDLFILRHGQAVERGAQDFEDDCLRPLTPKGIRNTKKAARGMRSMGIAVDTILTSPLVRAKETAQIFAKETRLRTAVNETDALRPEASPEEILDVLDGVLGSSKSAVLVGHQPNLGSLISLLATGDLNLSLNLKKGSICKLSLSWPIAPACGTLEWVLTTKQQARIV